MSSGETVKKATLNSSDTQFVESGGTTISTTIKSGGYQYVSSGGVANATRIFSGGDQWMHGQAIKTTIFSGGFQGVWSGGLAKSTVIESGGNQNVAQGGSAILTKVKNDGDQFVFSNGWTSATTLSGGSQWLFDDGVAKATTILRGASQIISSAGSALSTKISGGSQTISVGGIASATKIYSGGVQSVSSGGITRATTVAKEGLLSADPGAIVSSVTLKAGASMFMANGTLYGKNKFTGATVYGTPSNVTLAKKATLSVGGETSMSWNLNLAQSAGVSITGSGNTMGGLTTSKKSKVAYDIRKLAAKGDTTMLKLTRENKSSIALEIMDVKNAQENGQPLRNQPFDSISFTYSGTNSSITLQFREADKSLYTGSSATYSTLLTAFQHALEDYENDNPAMAGIFTVSLGSSFSAVATTGRETYKSDMGSYIVINCNSGNIYLGDYDGWSISSGSFPAIGGIIWDMQSSESGRGSQELGQFSVTVAKKQGMGTYELSQNIDQDKNFSYTVNLGSTKLGTVKLNGKSLTKNGVTYSLKSADSQISLTLAIKAGEVRKGTDKADKLGGTAHSDIFYGGKGNDTITGKNGRDVAVYDTTAWGKDVIAKTDGTMTLLFKDLTSSDIKKSLSNNTMTITKKNDSSQKITVKGWSNDTHDIVFGNSMTAFNTFLKKTNPTTTQISAARKEVFKKAGLASA
ncbi:MAG: AIDA repeat-containing protein [Desulfovibrionaceae bacterium]|nr:AIDA repeat-containing protein [Desulfovibrionaceae bacterium]